MSKEVGVMLTIWLKLPHKCLDWGDDIIIKTILLQYWLDLFKILHFDFKVNMRSDHECTLCYFRDLIVDQIKWVVRLPKIQFSNQEGTFSGSTGLQ